MRLLLDQMLREDLAADLRQMGHDVVRASDRALQTADDQEILSAAIAEDRVLVTLDEHFGDWAILPLDTHPGVIRLKINPTTSQNARHLLTPFLEKHDQQDFRNHLIIASRHGERWIRTG